MKYFCVVFAMHYGEPGDMPFTWTATRRAQCLLGHNLFAKCVSISQIAHLLFFHISQKPPQASVQTFGFQVWWFIPPKFCHVHHPFLMPYPRMCIKTGRFKLQPIRYQYLSLRHNTECFGTHPSDRWSTQKKYGLHSSVHWKARDTYHCSKYYSNGNLI